MDQVAYTLRAGALATSGPVVFGGIPGRWSAGKQLTTGELGRTEEQMDELIETTGVPLAKVGKPAPKRPAAAAVKPSVKADEEA